MLNSFRWKIILPCVIVAVLFPLLFHVTWQHWYIKDVESTIIQRWIKQLQYVEQIDGDEMMVQYLNYMVKSEDVPTGTYMDILDSDGQLSWSSDPTTYEMRRNQRTSEDRIKAGNHVDSFDRMSGIEITKSKDKDGNLYIIVPLGASDSSERYSAERYIELTYPVQRVIVEDLERKQRVIWGMMAIFAICGLVIGSNLWRTIFQPIFDVTRVARKVAKGQYEHQIALNSKDEFGQLANALNEMVQAIREKVTELSDEKSKLEGVLNDMLSGVLLINMKGQVRYANPSAERILHANKDSLISRNHQEVLGDYGLSGKIEDALTKGEFYRDQIRLENLGIHHVVEVSIVPIRNINRLIHSVIVVIHDISEIKRLEQVRAEFVANVSHELKTPITSIKGFAETILDGDADSREEMLEFTKIIHKEAARLSNLVHDLLELSKLEANDANLCKKDENLVEIAREVINNLQYGATKQSRDISLYVNRDRIIHFVNRDRIKQVLINLISNSIAYSKLHTTIHVRIFDNDRDVVIEVEDHGVGIPESDLPRIFERFYRVQKDRSRATGGTGLGLSIVKHIVEIHDGKIEVDSKVGVGTTFRIAFPKGNAK